MGVGPLVRVAAGRVAGIGQAPDGFHANRVIDASGLVICPGLIETGMTRPIFELARERGSDKKLGQLNPLKRAGQPVEIARMALFLASDEASYVNGQAFAVDGGLSSSHPFVPGRIA